MYIHIHLKFKKEMHVILWVNSDASQESRAACIQTCLRVSVAVRETTTKSSLERKVLTSDYSSHHSLSLCLVSFL